VLYALLNSKFLSLVHYETRTSNNSINLFSNGKLLPYSELLMLSRQEIIIDAKILLPFWYTIPVISWIARFILAPAKKHKKQTTSRSHEKQQNTDYNTGTKSSRKQELKKAARSLEEKMVTPGSTLERDLSSYVHEWNRLISEDAQENLTEDINSLIRDYMRKTIRTLQSSHFTKDRVSNLAKTLVNSPALHNIRNKDALEMYIKLYIVKLIKNL
ncbi:MAG TPA: hypothetical protein VFC68_03455, partial [Treponemataceae bacterium]|nr:hypothetical protein [Treponemataceae bacterium]